MFRKIMIAAVLSLTFLSPLALTPQAQAHESHGGHGRYARPVRRVGPVRYVRPATCSYTVYFRGCASEAWRVGGNFCNRAEAWRVMHNYQGRGLQSYIR
jgi:hypothetical protein